MLPTMTTWALMGSTLPFGQRKRGLREFIDTDLRGARQARGDPVVERADPAFGQRACASECADHAANGGPRGVGVPTRHHGNADAGAEVAVPRTQCISDRRSVVDHMD